MICLLMNYFSRLSQSLLGECYFRVSKHLGITISEVISKKFTPDIRLLIAFYLRQINAEIEEQKKYEEELEGMK